MLKYLRAPLIAMAPILLLAVPTQARVIGRLVPVSDFSEVPAEVAQEVARRGCKIPQVEGVSERHNVVQGQFERRGQRDWAVLCLQGNTSTILVYWNGSVKNAAQLAPRDETITPSKNGYYRILHVVDRKFIRNHYSTGETPKPPRVIDHDGIDDGIYGKGSSVHYFYNREWLELGGSD
jgi:hypothetical protein